MNQDLHRKLRLKGGEKIGTVNKPKGFEKALLPLPVGSNLSKGYSADDDVIFWFVKNVSEFEAGLDEVLTALSDNNVIWIGYPKGSSGIQTDLTRDKGWDSIMNRTDISFIAFISFNNIWSTFCIRRKTAADRKREAKPDVREIFKYADSKTKTITLPDDLAEILNKNKAAKELFDALSFSNRREYVEWVVNAKREETRKTRVSGTIEKLLQGYKNPAGR